MQYMFIIKVDRQSLMGHQKGQYVSGTMHTADNKNIIAKYSTRGHCHFCGKSGQVRLKSCGDCKCAQYCDESHQQQDHAEHKVVCEQLKILSGSK